MNANQPVKIQLGSRRERLALILGVLLILGAGVPFVAMARPEMARARIQVLAHRGASAYAPENTLAAFRMAIEQKADWLEMDVQQTKDGQLVVFHDLRMERTTNGRGNLRDLTLAQVRELDAGTWFDPAYAGERVPTFEEVVALARDGNVKIFPELKDPKLYPGIEEHMAAVLSQYGFEDQTVVQSFDMDSLKKLRQINPKIRQAALYTTTSPLRGEPPPGVSVVGPPWEVVAQDPNVVRDAHAAGRQVVVWTVDAPKELTPMLSARVDGIITNRPDVVRGLLETR